MAYRNPTPPPRPQLPPEVDEYEKQLGRTARRKRIVIALVIGGLTALGLGSCFGPIGYEVAKDEWTHRKTRLTKAEITEVSGLQQDLVLRVERSLQQFFVAAGPPPFVFDIPANYR